MTRVLVVGPADARRAALVDALRSADLEVPGAVSTRAMIRRLVGSVGPNLVVVSHGELHGSLPRRIGGVPVVVVPDCAGERPSDVERWARCGVRYVQENLQVARPDPRPAARRPRSRKDSVPHPIVLIGASTGGPQVLEAILRALPPTTPPVVIAQHMPAYQTARLAARLDQLCQLTVREAEDGAIVAPGEAWIAKGGLHLEVVRQGSTMRLRLSDAPLVNGHRPSVDVLFESLVRAGAAGALAMVLTGMGSDGANGLLELRRAGALTLVQDEATATVYGMPRVAWERGAAERREAPRALVASILNYASG